MLLAIESATIEVAVALLGGDGPLSTVTARLGRRHAETLHPEIATVLELGGSTLQDLDAVAVDVGPGLFTGLRVGVATANALGAALGIPVIGATSLDIIAAARQEGAPEILPVVDMRRGEIAWQLPGSRLPFLGSLEAFFEAAEPLVESGQRLWLAGDGALRYRSQISERIDSAHFLGSGLAAPRAEVLGALALSALELGTAGEGPARPLYLRDADVAINWESRHGRSAS